MIKVSDLDLRESQKQERMNIRNCYLIATEEELLVGMRNFQEKGNWFAVACLFELYSEF